MNWKNYKNKIKKISNIPENWYILGIDLGTTNSIISYWNFVTNKPEPIDISNGFGKIPLQSVVQYRKDNDNEEGEWIIGDEAYRSMKIYNKTTIRSIKRKMGTNEVINIYGKKYLPEEISAKILQELIKHCKNLNPKAEIIGLVVSVPYDFDDAAKKATMKAIEIAELSEKLICLIEEPKAAALAYNFRHDLKINEKIMVFDFGGGTLDITIFHVAEKNNDYIKLKVISEGGKSYHGGDNIDEIILSKCYSFIKDKINKTQDEIDIENQIELIIKSKEIKERLSGVKNFRIPFTFCIPPFVEQINRELFEELISPFINKTKNLVLKTLKDAYGGSISPESIDRILLEGGSSQMPWVKYMINEIFNDENKIYSSEKPALDISIGATYYAAIKMGILSNPDLYSEKISVEFEVTVPHDIGLEIQNKNKKTFFTMIKRGTPYTLAKKSQVFILRGETEKDMSTFDLKIMERINKDDDIENCKLIGEVCINGLPIRPNGKTKLEVTLLVEEDGGVVKGYVKDLGFENEYNPVNFKQYFDPTRFKKIYLGE